MIELRIDGDGAGTLAQRLAEYIRAELHAELTPRKVQAQPATDARVTGVEVACLVLAIPPALLATMELGERLDLVRRLRGLVALYNQRDEPDARVTVHLPDGASRDLDEVEVGEILDQAELEHRQQIVSAES